METKKYTVYFLNGNEKDFQGFIWKDAVILGTAHALNEGWDKRIKYVFDHENGITHSEIDIHVESKKKDALLNYKPETKS